MKSLKRIINETKIYYLLFIALFILIFVLNKNFISNINTFDYNILLNAIKMQTPLLTFLMKGISFFGSAVMYIIIILIFLFIIRKKKLSLMILITSVSTFLMNLLLKNIYMRGRPHSALINEPGFSLPSFHAMCSIAIYGLIIYFVQKYIKNKNSRCILTILFTVLILLIGFSRIYLNVHFTTDVLIGYLFGYILLLIFKRINDIINKE